MEKIDIDKAKKSLEYLYEIYSEMSSNADELSKKRCPYKNAKSRCTATFECRNQHFLKNSTELAICTGSDLLDYRPAWKI